MSGLPAPLTPPECDLRDFAFMPFDVRRFRDSDMLASEDPDVLLAAIMLWSASWHQVPAASLPDDDRMLAQLAGYGRAIKEWRKVRTGALRNFIQCSDGRLYHTTVSEKANEAWQEKIAYRERKAKRQTAGAAGAESKWKNSADERRTRSERLAEARQKGRHTKDEWLCLVDACGNVCVRCGDGGSLVKDHITPIYQGGSDGVENLQPLCGRCNSSKGPDATDHRPNAWQNEFERLAKRLATNEETPRLNGFERLPKGTGTGTVEEEAPSPALTDSIPKPEPSHEQPPPEVANANDALNYVCRAAEWRPANDTQRQISISIINGWLALGCTVPMIVESVSVARKRDPSPTRSLKRFDSTVRGRRRDQLGGQLPVTSSDVEALRNDVARRMVAK